jgi:hypothetical protein
MGQIAGDEGSAEWKSSRPASRGKVKAAWLADAIARADSKRRALTAQGAEKESHFSKTARSGGPAEGAEKKKVKTQGRLHEM